MITLQNAATTIVDVGTTNWAFSPGVWQFETVVQVKGYTNEWVNVSGLRDGAVITVDTTGYVGWVNGPNLAWAVEAGIIAAFATVGLGLFGKWVLRKFGRAVVESVG